MREGEKNIKTKNKTKSIASSIISTFATSEYNFSMLHLRCKASYTIGRWVFLSLYDMEKHLMLTK